MLMRQRLSRMRRWSQTKLHDGEHRTHSSSVDIAAQPNTQKLSTSKRRNIMHIFHVICEMKMKVKVLAAGLILVSIIVNLKPDSNNNTQQMPSSPKQAGLNNITNEFVSTFAKIITQPTVGTHVSSEMIPLILRNGQLLCRSYHKRQIRQMRALGFIEMVSRGLELGYYSNPINSNTTPSSSSSSSASNDYGLPIILMNGDGSGCNIVSHEDLFSFPRLSWCIPSPKHFKNDESTTTSMWCNAVGMVSYETWGWFYRTGWFQKTYDKHHKWDDTFTKNEYRYPWTKKLAKAVWRGSSTHAPKYAHGFDDIPRARLVKLGIENPDVIDAGFTAIIQRFEKNREELEKKTRMVEHLPFEELMKYKGELPTFVCIHSCLNIDRIQVVLCAMKLTIVAI